MFVSSFAGYYQEIVGWMLQEWGGWCSEYSWLSGLTMSWNRQMSDANLPFLSG